WGAVGAPLVRGLVAQGQVDHAKVFVDAGDRPHVGRVAAVHLAGGQGLGVVRVVAVPVPHQAAVVHVVGADHPGRLVGRLVVGDVAADDHEVTGDRRGRGGVVAAGGERADAGGQVDHALVGEAFADLAGVGVDGDQAGIGGRQVEPARAGLGDCQARVGDLRRRAAVAADVAVLVIVGDATAGHVGEALEGAHWAFDLRVVAPDLGTSVRVQGQQPAVGGAGIEHAVDLQRGVLVGQLHRVVFGRQVAGADAPGFLQAVDVLWGDLAQRRVAIAMLGTAVGLPFAVGHRRGGAGHFAAVTAQFAMDLARV